METEFSSHLRKSGIPFINDIPWGTHICGFYQTKKDLIDISIPFFRAGLENNEFCIWVVAEPLSTAEANYVLRNALPDFNTFASQIEILSPNEWYLKYGKFDRDKVLEAWTDKYAQILARGYEGLRVCGSTKWLHKRYWKTFMDYENKLEEIIGEYNIVCLCAYQLDDCEIHEVLDLVNNHQFSFIKCKHDWQSSRKSLAKFDRLHLIGKMAASVAHEIRNPMTSVKGFIQLLQSKQDFTAYQEYFTLMLEELDRANGIISEYLSLARERENNLQMQNLNRILASLLPLLQADALKEDKDIIIRSGEIPDLLLDPKEIRQVILNLARNGLEAMNQSGVLEFLTYVEENQVILEVRDSGNGIPEEILNNLGTPFMTTKENGTGLGLSICFNILESYNARVKVQSSASGTTFKIYFPFYEQNLTIAR
ncbi:MAG: MEDS domain-containing protein [Desulfitobacteriia bacterium]